MQPLMNTWKTWTGIAGLIVVATKAMGASTWSWSLTLLVAGALALSSFIAALLMRPRKSTDPQKGGDVTFMTGRGIRGGENGRFVFAGHSDSSSATPMFTLSWRDALDRTTGSVDLFVTPGDMPPSARSGSFLVTLDRLRVYHRLGEQWLQVFSEEGS